MNITKKRVIDLTPQEYRQCYSLNLRNEGQMMDCIGDARYIEKYWRRNRRFSQVVMITESNCLLAWALVMPRKKRRGWEAQFYTRRSERNKGLGTQLFKEVQTIDPKPYVIPWSKSSGEFFKKHRKFIKFDPEQAQWLN